MGAVAVTPRQAIFLLAHPEGKELGTAFLCAPDLALTAYHCVPQSAVDGEHALVLKGNGNTYQAHYVNGDPDVDYALLKLSEPAAVTPLPVSRRSTRLERVRITGWPSQRESEDAQTLSATIVELECTIRDGISAMQVQSPEAASGATVHGLSGSPLILERENGTTRAVGVLRCSQEDPEGEDRAPGGTLYACRINDILSQNKDLIDQLLRYECGVYISFHENDRSLAFAVNHILNQHGIDTVLRDEFWNWGEPLGDHVKIALQAHPVTVVIRTEKSESYDYAYGTEIQHIWRYSARILPLYFREPRATDEFLEYRPINMAAYAKSDRKKTILTAVSSAICDHTIDSDLGRPDDFQYAPIAWTAQPDMIADLLGLEGGDHDE